MSNCQYFAPPVRLTRRKNSPSEGVSMNLRQSPAYAGVLPVSGSKYRVRVVYSGAVFVLNGTTNRDGGTIYFPIASWPKGIRLPQTGPGNEVEVEVLQIEQIPGRKTKTPS